MSTREPCLTSISRARTAHKLVKQLALKLDMLCTDCMSCMLSQEETDDYKISVLIVSLCIELYVSICVIQRQNQSSITVWEGNYCAAHLGLNT
jgi:hypothetical protein